MPFPTQIAVLSGHILIFGYSLAAGGIARSRTLSTTQYMTRLFPIQSFVKIAPKALAIVLYFLSIQCAQAYNWEDFGPDVDCDFHPWDPACGGWLPGDDDDDDDDDDTCGEGANPFHPENGNVRRVINDMDHLAGGLLRWSRVNNSIPRMETFSIFGAAACWRHSWQYDLHQVDRMNLRRKDFEFVYPSGQAILLRLNAAGIFYSLNGGPEFGELKMDGRIVIRGYDGSEMNFRKIENKYICEKVINRKGRTAELKYSNAGKLQQVSDEHGNTLTLKYKNLNYTKRRVKEVARAKQEPHAAQWLDIVLPTLSTSSIRSIHLRSARSANIAEVQIIGTDPSGPIAINALAADGENALDGNPNTSITLNSQYSECGFRITAGDSQSISSIRVLSKHGLEHSLAGLKVYIETNDREPMFITVLDSVSSSDGRSVSYDYQAVESPIGEQVALVKAIYGDGTSAKYNYLAEKQSGSIALLSYADDPRYKGPAKKIAYRYQKVQDGSIFRPGAIEAEVNPVTMKDWATLKYDENDPYRRIVNYSDDKFVVYKYRSDGSKRLEEKSDGLGRHARFEYSSNRLGNSNRRIVDSKRGTSTVSSDVGEGKSIKIFKSGVKATVSRNKEGRLIRSEDSTGKWLSVERGQSGRVSSWSRSNGDYATIKHNELGRVESIISNKLSVSITYDTKGRRSSITNSHGYKTSYIYNDDTRTVEEVNSVGQITKKTYNERGQLENTTFADGRIEQRLYDDYGLLSLITRGNITTRYSYDSFSRLIRVEDGRDGATTFDYDGPTQNCSSCSLISSPTTVTHPDGRVTRNLYDSGGRKIAVTENWSATESSAQATTTYTYDDDDNIISVKDALGRTTRFTYNESGRRLSQTDPLGRTTLWSYDEQGNVVREEKPDGGVTEHVYDQNGRRIRSTAPNGAVTKYGYDKAGNLISLVDPLGSKTQYVFEGDQRVATILSDGTRNLWTYDEAGRVIESISPDGAVTRTAYDTGNRILSQKTVAANGAVLTGITNTYDTFGRRVSMSDALGRTTRFTYDAHGNVLTTTRPDGVTTGNAYDAKDRLLSTTDALGQTTRYAYDDANNLTVLTDARGNVYRFTYDGAHRKTAMIYPDGTRETWSYDRAGQMTSYVNRSGQTKRVNYNLLGQPLMATWSNPSGLVAILPVLAPTLRYSYDRNGRLASLQSIHGEQMAVHLTYKYDELGRLASETTDLSSLSPGLIPETVTYGYDELGRRSRLGYPDKSKVAYTYDARNRLISIADRGPTANNPLAAYTYDALGRITKLTRDNGVVTHYTYDVASQLTDIEHRRAGEVLAASHYVLDVLGRRSGQTREERIRESYTYDATGQLTGADYGTPSRGAESFTYDAVGNRTQAVQSVSASTTGFTTNNLNQYTSVADVTLGYDTNGNLVDDGRQVYRYDSQNRLVVVEGVGLSAPVRAEFFYDARNRCVIRKYYTKTAQGQWVLNNSDSRALTYDSGWNLISERTLGGADAGKYIHGLATDEILASANEGKMIYPLVDGLGSTIALTNKNGKINQRFRYDAHGQFRTLSASYDVSNNPSRYRFLFTGREWLGAVRLNDHRNRYYSPSLGCWTSTDPIGFDGDEGNLYRFVRNSSPNYSDAFGLCTNGDSEESVYLLDGSYHENGTGSSVEIQRSFSWTLGAKLSYGTFEVSGEVSQQQTITYAVLPHQWSAIQEVYDCTCKCEQWSCRYRGTRSVAGSFSG